MRRQVEQLVDSGEKESTRAELRQGRGRGVLQPFILIFKLTIKLLLFGDLNQVPPNRARPDPRSSLRAKHSQEEEVCS